MGSIPCFLYCPKVISFLAAVFCREICRTGFVYRVFLKVMMEFDYYFFSLVFLENYIKNQSSEQGMIWMNLPERYRTDNAKFVILPIQYEKALTYGKGSSKGSVEIINASEHLEYYDNQFDCEPFEQGIRVLEPLSLNEMEPEEMVKIVSEAVKKIPTEKFLVGLGGDHAVTIGIVNGLEQIYSNDFSVIQFDAHADFRDSWNGSSLNHACVTKQISKKHSLLLV